MSTERTPLTPDEVAKAIYADTWRINLHEATVTEASIHMTRGMPRESSPVVYAVHHATLAELCRQLYAIVDEDHADVDCDAKRGFGLEYCPVCQLLALWPNDPALKEARDG